MKKSSITACPLDCYDACGIIYDENRLKPFKNGHTNGFLCSHLNHYDKFERIIKPRYKGQEITMKEALLKLKELFKSELKSDILHYRGSGNFALMQEVTDHFFANLGATLTNGTLCDGAGEAGIIEGRGSNKNMSLSEIEKSDVIIFWGRNPHTTSSHLLPLIKDKTIIVIDPVKTKIAQMADLHVQIKPHTDIYLALLLSRFVHINDSLNEEFVEKYASEFEEYYELTQSVRIKTTLENIGVTLGNIGDILEYTIDKKVAIVCGVGIQKYRDGADVMRSIDAFAVSLGFFGKEGCGVAYLGNSKEAIESPFEIKAKRVSKVNTNFDEFDTVFIQGSNPLAQMPDSLRVKNALEKTPNVVYFGLYENETSAMADLVIPAKTFLEKEDIRTSYSHNGLMVMNKQIESDIGISEYDLAAYLCKEFNIELKSEQEYLQYFKNFGIKKINGCFEVENREAIPYKDGFDTSDSEFVFLEEFETQQSEGEDEFNLITPKSHTSLNSQFKRDTYVYINPSHGYNDTQQLELTSENGSVVLEVKNDNRLRDDTLLIYSGTPGVNNLTSSKHSYEGKSAVFQENKVKITKK
ncbi:molybdopterin-dependent oxidoreductase [Sulfurimonas autotrophica]|uniref:Molybdopterin oxidoreductase n=1 Tax=Sulfurimonas autotrophica (strain ATCC BAA-671 / DSM 16294 / JCM 11897 / OK10) TaxID=563040 RepID=E0UTX4_SULAO|nr:molybdopterin-dependent oxidoreductase [Sulfurimonas autotrophica]ADN09418.1 molybdopterin oxidoreductase [Sulfurimonas autotrophica DSM 16294]